MTWLARQLHDVERRDKAHRSHLVHAGNADQLRDHIENKRSVGSRVEF